MNDHLIEELSNKDNIQVGTGFDFGNEGRDYSDTVSTRFGRLKEANNKYLIGEVQNPKKEQDPRKESFARDDGTEVKKGQNNSQEALSDNLKKNWAIMHEEYNNENDKEVPAHSIASFPIYDIGLIHSSFS